VLTHRFALGRHRVGVLVTGAGGLSSTAATVVDVRPVPPPGPLGITIDRGAPFSRGRAVTVNPIWPRGAFALQLSNDGGFRHPRRFAMRRSVAWRLPPLRPGQSAIVYARFIGDRGVVLDDRTYQDDIVVGPVRRRKPVTARGVGLPT
jgi:hypothetical protein